MEHHLRARRFITGHAFRFSLRTLMIVTVLAACGIKWWMKPDLTEYLQPDGARVRYSLSRAIDPVSKAPLEPRRHGRYEVRDKTGRLLVRGHYENGLPIGMWTVFHSNGKRAVRGMTISGEPSQEWTGWNDDGHITSRATYQLPATPRPMSVGKFMAPWAAQRVGLGEFRDGLGHLHRGKYTNGTRDGEWIETDDKGRVVNRWHYRSGVKHGKALETDQLGKGRDSNYLFGHSLPPVGEVLEQLERDLQSTDGGRQYEALRNVVLLGQATEKLLFRVLSGTDAALQVSALKLLAKEFQSSRSVLSQIETLTHSSNVSVAVEAWFTLYHLVPDRQLESAQRLIEVAAQSELPMRYAIEYRLGRQAGPITEAIGRKLESNDPVVREVAIETMAVVLFAPPVSELREQAVQERRTKAADLLAKARSHKDRKISAAAVQLEQSTMAFQGRRQLD